MTERWGAVYLWESREAAEQELPSRARELIGKDADIGEEFDIEATIEGDYAIVAAVAPRARLRRVGSRQYR